MARTALRQHLAHLRAAQAGGGHSVLGYLGSLAGHSTTDEAMADPVVREAVERMLREDVPPLLPEVDGIELPAYLDLQFVQPAEREQRDEEPRDTGVAAVVPSWSEVEQLVQERSS